MHFAPKAIKPVIVYDETAAGQSAMQAAESLFHIEIEDLPTKSAFWNFRLMEYPAWRIQATADVLGSDLLILAMHGEDGLPGCVARWLEECVAQKRGTDAAVVALFGPPHRYDGAESPRLQLVRQIVEEAGLHFFAPGTKAEDACGPMTVNLHAREQTITPTLDRILHLADRPAH